MKKFLLYVYVCFAVLLLSAGFVVLKHDSEVKATEEEGKSSAETVTAEDEPQDTAGETEDSEEEDDDEDDEYEYYSKAFSDNFKHQLHECKVDDTEDEDAERSYIDELVGIVGWKDDKCHLLYDVFELYVPQDRLTALNNIGDVRKLLKDREIAFYVPAEYNYFGLLESLVKNCGEQENKRNNVKSPNIHIGENLKTYTGLISERTENGCTVRLLNIAEFSKDEVKDYSIVCTLKESEVKAITDKYAEILTQKEGESTDDYEDRRFRESGQADEEIMQQLQNDGLCKKLDGKENVSQKQLHKLMYGL